MPVFESNGKKYNVANEYLNDFAKEHPDAFTVAEKEGQKYKVMAGDFQGFMGSSSAVLPEGNPGVAEASNRTEPIAEETTSAYSIEEGEVERLKKMKDEADIEVQSSPFFDRFFNPDTRAALAARNAAEEALEMREEAKHANEGWFDRNVMGVFRGIRDKGGDLATWDFGASGIATGVALNDAVNKMEKGEQLTSSEKKMLDAYGLASAVQLAYQDEVGMAYRVGGSLPESGGFMATLALNPAAGMGSKIAEGVAKQAVKKYGKSMVSKLAKVAARGVGDAAEMAVATGTIGAGRVAEDYYNRLNGQSTFTTDENGFVQYGGQMEREEADNAIWKAVGSQFIENYSEAVGEYFTPLGNFMSNLTSKGLRKGGLGKFVDFVSDVKSSQWSQAMKTLQDRTKFNGMVGEYLEEVAGNVMNAATVGDENFNWEGREEDKASVFNPEKNLETFLSCALMSGTMYAVQGAGGYISNKISPVDMNRKLMDAEEEASTLWGDRWADMKEQIDNADPDYLAKLMTSTQNATDLTDEQKQAVLNYAGRLMQNQGYNARKLQNVEEQSPEQNVMDDSYQRGMDANAPEEKHQISVGYNKAWNELGGNSTDAEEKQFAEYVQSLSANPVAALKKLEEEGFSEEQIDLAGNFYAAEMSMQGMTDAMIDDIDSKVNRANRLAQLNMNQDMGGVVPVVLNDGTEANLIRGTVVVDDEGNIDINQSDDKIFVRLQDGTVKMMNPHKDLSGRGEIMDPTALVEQNETVLRNQLTQQGANEIDYAPGTPEPVVGAQFSINGKPFVVSNVSEDGGQLSIVPSDAWQAAQGDEKKMQELIQVSSQQMIPTSEYKKYVSDMIDAGGQEQQNIPEEEQVQAGTQQAEVSSIPTREDGSVDFVTYGADNTRKMLSEKYGDKYSHKVEVTRNAAAKELEKAQKAVEKAQMAVDEAPIGKEAKAEEALSKAQAEYDSIKAEHDLWSQLDEENKTPIQNPVDNIPVEQEEVSQTNEADVPSYAVDESGEPIFDQIPTEQAVSMMDELGDNAPAFIDSNVFAAEKAFKKAMAMKPKATSFNALRKEQQEIAAMQSEAKRILDAWTAIKDAYTAAHTQSAAFTPKAEGLSRTRTLPNGAKLKGRYVLVSAADLIPSHNPMDGWKSTEGFPLNEKGQNINDRDYEHDKDAQKFTEQIAQNYGGQAIEQVPTISREGIVYDGNGRVMAGQMAAANKTDAEYMRSLHENAEMFGFTQDQIDNIPNARVVFMLDENLPYTTDTFAQFNTQEKKSQSNTEKAVAHSKKLSEESVMQIASVIDEYNTLDSFFGSEKGIAEILRTLQDNGILSANEIAGLKEGELLNAQGREFVTSLLLGAVFDENAIRQLGSLPALKNTMLRAIKSIIANRQLKEYALTEEISNAISLLYEAKKAGMKLELYMRQTNMFEESVSDRFTEFDMLLATAIESGVDSFRDILNAYNQQGSLLIGGQMNIFDGGVTSKEELKNLILEHYGKESETDTSADSGHQENHAGERIQEGDEQEGSTEEAGTEEVSALSDEHGNPLNETGSLKLEPVNSIDELTDEDFMNPTRNVELPKISDSLNKIIGAGKKPVIIKKNIFEKNKAHHGFSPESSRSILKDALYNTDIAGQTQPIKRPNYWLAIKVDNESPIVVLEVNESKENIEIVGWYTLDERNLQRIQRQAKREGGEFLILTSSKDAAASLSTLPSGSSSVNKDNEASDNKQETNAKKGENDITSTEEQVVEETKELTEDEINASDLDESMKIGAIAYLHGDRSSAVVMSYQIVKDYVRNQSRIGAADSSNANEAQLGSGTDEAASRESGQSGSDGSGLDREEGDGTLSGTVSSGETGEDSVASPAGKRSNRKVGGRKSDKGNERSGDTGSGSGSTVRSDGRDVRGQQGHGNSEGLSEKDGIRGTETGHSEDSADDIISSALGDIKDILSHPLQLPKDRFYDATSLVAALGVNAVKLFTATARLGYGLVLKGFHSYQKWQGQMHDNLDTILKENTKLTDAQIDEFIKSMWDYPTKFKGEIHKVSEWADMLAQEEMRKMISMSVEEKRKLQKAAEKTPTIIGDLDNIRESLPFLLPDQQKDVQLAENQFFDKSHSDSAHGNGKGYMFTNGTGTGKTYTGLGIVKRFLKQGKGRILIVTAQDKKIQDWIHDAENLGIKATMLENTTSKGKGVVVTQYANIRQNYELLKDEFDLIVYDESHKLMENQSGQLTTTATFHHMLANRDVEQALLRQLQNTPLWVKERQLLAESKELEQLTEAMNKSNPSREVEDEFIRRGGTDGVSRRYNEIHVELNNVKESQEEELKKQKANEKAREQAQNAVNKTKVVFLSATPFNTASSLDYVESYIFSYPQQDNASITRDKRRNSFIMQNFPSSHTRNSKGEIQRLGEGSISDPEAASKEEVAFSDHLQNDLNTMSGRMLDTTYDYSREFPELDMPQAKRFNQAVQELTNGRYAALQPYFKHLLSNYPEMTALFEAIKTAGSINRIREHIKLGRKVVVFHRRISAKEPLEPPFDKGLRLAAQEKDQSIQNLASKFEDEFYDLLNWEQNINLDFPHNQIVNSFATPEDRKRYSEKVEEWLNKLQDAQAKGKPMPQKPRLEASSVRLFNGTETNSYRNAATEAFNDDNSDVKVIVVQVQSGKEGISLHDTTGKHQRVELSLQLPQSPIEFIQAEGRIYRVGNKSDAIFEYPLLGINIELASFAGKINGRSQTSENLALGSQARGLRESIARAALSSRRIPVEKGQGVGGKKLDSKAVQNATGFDFAKDNYNEWSADPIPSDLDDVQVPDPIGYKMIEWATMTNGEELLVPYAGTGTIARYAPTSVKLTALEGKMDRYSRLVALLGGGGRKIDSTEFKDFATINKADCVVMNGTHNKTFSLILSDSKKYLGDQFNAMKGATHLEDGGRLIMIVNDENIESVKMIKNFDCVMRGEIKLPKVAMGGHPTTILIYDKLRGKNKDLATESIREDFTDVTDLNELFEKLRKVKVPSRIIDKTGRIKKRVKKYIKEIEKSNFIASRRFQGKSEKAIAFSDSGIYITFKNGTISMPIPGYGPSNYRNFQLDFEKLINDTPSAISYQQEAAQLWQYLKDNTTMSDSDLRSRYSYRKDAAYDQIRELSEVLKNFIAAAMNKTDTQMDNIARGERENKISGELTFQQYKDAFKSLNSGDAGLDALAERVFDVVEQIDGMKFRVVGEDRMSGHNVAAHYVPSRNCIELNGNFFNSIKYKDSLKSSTIVHEMIHAVTCYYMDAYQSGAQLPDYIKDACKDIYDVYEHINNNEFRSELRIHSRLGDNAEYGLTNPEEMMAELANPIFRAQLKAKKLWRQLVNGIKRLLGMDVVKEPNTETDALTVLENALETLLDNYDPQVYEDYIGGNVMFNLSSRKENPQAEYQAEFNQGNFNSVGDGTNVEKEIHKRNEIIKNLHSYSESLKGVKNTSHFISDIKQILGLNSTGASSYGRFTLHDGTKVSLRISNHSVNAGNYVGSRNNVEHNNSIVISSKRNSNNFVPDENIELTEYVYIKERLAKSDSDCLSQIVNSIAEMLKTGEYHDTTGLAIRHRSGEKEDNNLFRMIPSFDDGHLDIHQTSEGYSVDGLSETFESKAQLLNAFRDKYPNYFVTLNDNKLEISNWNEEDAEEMKRSPKEQREFEKYLERKTRNAKKQISELSATLGLDVEVKESLDGLEGRKAKAKGWFDTDTGKIVIVLPNHTNVEDVLTTVLHEGVAHYGLRKLYGNHFDTFLDNVYNHVTDDVRHKINVLAARNGWNHRLATEEYLASMAEDINYERAVKSGVWKTVRAFLVKMLAKAGFNVPNISDNELRYILWRSYDNLKHPGKRSILGVAEDIATQDRLGVGNYTKDNSSAAKVAEDNLRFRTDEMDDIITKAKADGTYMKAPNGKMSNLNERQWAQVRTKAFKEWFGDWEKAARIVKLRNSKTVQMTGEEYKGKYELERESAKDWIKDNLRGEFHIDDTGELIQLTRVGADKVTSHSMGSNAHLKSIAAIPELIKNAIFIEERANEKGNDKFDSYRYYVCGLRIGKTDYTVKLTIGVKQGKKYYDHALTEIEKGKLLDAISQSGFKAMENASLPSSAVFKDTKLVSILQTNSSKVIDENGEPLVVYHGTKSDFNVFKPNLIGSNLDYGTSGYGFYFTTDRENAENIARNAEGKDTPKVMEAFLNIRNPKDNVSTNELNGDEKSAKSFSAQAKSDGYDGIAPSRFGLQWYVVFNPNQIKSATDNVGTFSKNNNDIRYRMNNDNAREIQSLVDKHLKKYKSQEVFVVEASMKDDHFDKISTTEGTSKAIREGIEVGTLGGHYKETDKVIIFADNNEPQLIEETLFHENLHYLLKNDKSLCNIFDNATKGKFLKNRERIAKWYRESDRVEELFVLFLAHAMATGDFHRFEDNLSAEDFEKVKQLIKQQGYEYGEEINSRGIGRTGNVGSIRQAESGRGSSVHESSGRGVGETKEEERRKEVADAVSQLADKFGVQVEVISDRNNVENENIRLESQMAAAKGWFEPSTNKVVIVLSNNKNRSDAMETLLHEIVGHKGMRELFGKDFDSFLDHVYDHCSDEMKKEIDSRMEKYGEDRREATDEYIAHIAERMAHEKPSKGIRDFVYMVRDAFVKLLKKFGFDANYSISDEYLMYLLWKSYNKMSNNDVMGSVRDFDMQRSLGVDGGIRFRKSVSATSAADDIARTLYEKALQKKSYRFQEGYQDAMLSLKHLQQAIEKESGKKLEEWENAYMAENQMSSRDTAELENFEYLYFKPMMKAVADFMKSHHVSYDHVRNYLFAKSGLERNRDFAIRDSLNARKKKGEDVSEIYEDYLKEKKELVDELNDGKITFREFCDQMDEKAILIAPDYMGGDYSGLSSFLDEDNFTDEAIELVESLDGPEAEEMWNKINSCNQFSLDRAKKSGVMSVENHKKLSEMFEWYVPMRGWNETVARDVYDYFGGDEGVFNPTVHVAKGRHSLADDPLATIGNIAESSIFQGNRNEMKQKFLNMAFNKPSSLITVMNSWIENRGTDDKPRWEYVYPNIEENDTPEQIAEKIKQFEEEMKTKKEAGTAKVIKGKADIPYIATPKEVSEHIVRVKRNGREYVLILNADPRAAQAINGLTNPTTSKGLVEWWTTNVNPLMAAAFTTKNPTFIVRNLSRDLIFSNTAVSIKENASYRKKFRSNQFKVLGNIKGLLKRFQSNSLDMNSPMDVMFKEFIMNGGETGFAQLSSVDEFKKRIKKELKRAKNGKISNVGKSVFEVIEFYNRCAEDVSRFTVYMTSREEGRSIQRSISDAKEITVNFNRRGSGANAGGWIGRTSQIARASYLFFNAAVQSLINFKRLGVKNPVAFTAAISTYLAAGTIIPIVNNFLSSVLGGDDDDYTNLPEWTRRNNMVLSLGKWNGDAMFFTVPLPIEMRAFYGLGEAAYQVMTGHEKGKDAALSITGQFAEMLPLNFVTDAAGVFNAFVPDAFKPFAQAYAMNKDWTGKPIYRDNAFNKNLPEWTKAYAGTSDIIVNSAELMNELTGGDKFKPGSIDVNPARIEHLLNGFFGGFADAILGTAKTIQMMWNPDYRNVRNTPVIKAFLQQSDERTNYSQIKKEYARYREEFLETGRLRSAYEKASDRTDDPKKYTQKLVELESSPAFIRYEIMKDFEDELSDIYDEMKEDPSLEPVNRTLINVIKEIAVKELNQIK